LRHVLLQAPDVLVNDATLQLLVELRPATQQDLSSVSGFGAAALQHFGQPLLQVVQDFCRHSLHLKHNTDWVTVKRMRTAAQAGQQQQFQQHLQQFKMLSTPGLLPGSAGTGPPAAQGHSSLQLGPWHVRGCSHASSAAAAAAGAGPVDTAAWHQQLQQQEAAGAGPLLTADHYAYQALLDSKVLSEPKKAASSAWGQWELGQTVTQIATEGREKPVQVGWLKAHSTGCVKRLQDWHAGLAVTLTYWLKSEHRACRPVEQDCCVPDHVQIGADLCIQQDWCCICFSCCCRNPLSWAT
jgi:hypothetical protein